MRRLPGHTELLPVRQSFASGEWQPGCHAPMPRSKWQITECRCRKHRNVICIRSASPCRPCCSSCRICRIPAANPPDFQTKSGMAAKQDDGSESLLPFSPAMRLFRLCFCVPASFFVLQVRFFRRQGFSLTFIAVESLDACPINLS